MRPISHLEVSCPIQPLPEQQEEMVSRSDQPFIYGCFGRGSTGIDADTQENTNGKTKLLRCVVSVKMGGIPIDASPQQ